MSGRRYGQEICNDFLSTFSDLGLDKNSPDAPLAYYQSIRSRFHSGRNWYKSLGNTFLFTPFIQTNTLLSDILTSGSNYHDKMFADLFSALGEWSLDIPFETPDRKFHCDLLDNSPFRNCDIFDKNDFLMCNQEIREGGKLSHHYRKTLHVISTKIVLDIVSNSG